MTAVAGDQLPVEIQDSETIVRATKTPHHVNKNQTRLRPSAFRPPPGETTISVMRQLMGDDFCKNKGVEICGEEYIGLATITAIEIRCRGSLVLDHRVDFPVAAGKAANLVGERPMPSIARFGRLAYPMRGEVTNRAVLGRERHGRPGIRSGWPAVGTTWVAANSEA